MRPLGLLTLAAALMAGGAAHAADWTVDAGAVERVRPSHLGSSQYITDGFPVLQASYGQDLTLSIDDGAKWYALRSGSMAFGPVVEFRESFDQKLPATTAFRMDDAIEAGLFGQVKTPLGTAEARLRRAVNSYQGWSGDLSFDTGGQVAPKLQVGGELRLSWADANFTHEYFGLSRASARSAPRFLGNDYYTAGAELDAARELTPKSRLVMLVSADQMIGRLQPSPLIHTRNIFSLSLGMTYHWSQADRRTSP